MITERTDRGMDVMEELLGKYQIRKSRAQKEAFSGFVEGLCEKWGYPFQAEEGTNLIRCRNLVAGDPEKAEFICTAHYDTCALMPIPNFITPKNPLVFLLYQLMIVGIVFCLAFSAAYLAGRLGGGMLGSMLAAGYPLLCADPGRVPQQTHCQRQHLRRGGFTGRYGAAA